MSLISDICTHLVNMSSGDFFPAGPVAGGSPVIERHRVAGGGLRWTVWDHDQMPYAVNVDFAATALDHWFDLVAPEVHGADSDDELAALLAPHLREWN